MSALLALNDRLWPLVTIILVLAVTVLSLLPMPELPVPSAALSAKLHHFIAYAAVAVPVSLARPRGWLLLLMLIAAWGGVIEILQPYVGRGGAVFDALVNAAGVATGAVAAAFLRRLSGVGPRPSIAGSSR